MQIALAILLLAVLVFGFVVFFGPPYLPTMRRSINTALDMLELKPGQTLLELGSGDGRVLLAAARRGYKAVGIELSPLLAIISWLITLRYRRQVRVIWGNYFRVHWPPADAIFTFMLQRQMARLDSTITAWQAGPIRLASFAFRIPGKRPLRVQDGVHLYEYK